jgi:hypothetical protein
MALYVVALLTLPVDIGVRVGGAVLTPARFVLIAAAVLAALEWRSIRAAVTHVPRSIWIGWAAFLGAALITALMAPSAGALARYASLVAEGLIVFTLTFNALSRPNGLRVLVTVFAVTMVTVAAVVLLLAAMGQHYDYILSGLAGTEPAPANALRYGLERQAGPFRGALYFAIWLTATSALLLPAMARRTGRTRVLAVSAWVVLLVAVVVLTASRLAMTTIFLLPAAYFLVRGPRPLGVASLVAAIMTASGLALFIPAGPVIDGSNSLRISALGSALQAIGAHPLFGSGLLTDMTVLSAVIGKKNYVDNTYLSLAIEIGLVGLAGFLLLVAAMVAATRRGWSSARGLAMALAVAAVLGMALLASVLQSTQCYAAFFVLGALAVGTALRADGTGQPAAAT